MSNQEPYSYVVLRYVHDVLRGEFMNAGIVMFAPASRRVLAKFNPVAKRFKQVFPDLKIRAYTSAIDNMTRGMQRVAQEIRENEGGQDCKTALDCAVRVLPMDDSALQWSHVGYGITPNVEQTLDQLYGRFVAQCDKQEKKRQISDTSVWQGVAGEIRKQKVKIDLKPVCIKGHADEVEFRRAWKNGSWQAYEPLSFDLSADGIKDKARKVLGQLTAVKDGAKEDVHVHFIVGKPQTKSLIGVYENALDILDHVPFEHDIYEESQLDKVVQTMKVAD